MSNIFAIYRNSYLHSRSSSVNPRIINRCVDLAREQPALCDISYYEPPWFRVTSEQPTILLDHSDVTRRPLAFGQSALKKLRREIHDNDQNVVVHALLGLCDLVHDPERAYEAMNLDIPKRVADKLLDPLPPVREAAAHLLQILAGFADGKEAIVTNQELLENLVLGLGDGQISVRMKVATCFEMMAISWAVADVLVDSGLIQALLEIIEKDEILEIVEVHLDTLKSLMYGCGKCVAIKNNGYKIFEKLLNHHSKSVVRKALDCLTLLTSTRKGKKLAMEKNLLKTLNNIIHYQDMETCTKAVSVIMFCTVKTRAKILAAEIKPLPKRLIKLADNPLNVTLQMFCLKALTNICEHPEVRKTVREHYLEELMEMQVDSSNKQYKKILLGTISWVPQNFV